MLPEWLGRSDDIRGASGGGSHSFIARTLAGVEAFFHVFETAETLSARPGFLQALDPRLKLITFLTTIVGITVTHHLRPLAMLYAATLVLALLSHLPLRALLLRTWIFIPFFTGIMALPVLLSGVTPGPAIGPVWPPWSWGSLHIPALIITRPGLRIVSLLVMRVATTVSWSLLLLWTTPWNELLAALQILRVPQALVFVLAMTVRYLVLLVWELEEIHVAIQSRALYRLSSQQGRRAVTGAIGAMLQKSILWAEEVFGAMASRGFTGRIVLIGQHRIGVRDVVWLGTWITGLVWIWHRGT